jgi:HK97 family phage major capsid protein
MSIQESREKMARTRLAALTVDAEFFGKVNAEKDKLDNKNSQHPADWRRLRGDVTAWMKEASANLGTTERETAAWEYAEGVIAYTDAKIAMADLANAVGTATAGPPSSGWIDAKTKKAIKVYKPGERIAAQRGGGDVSLGALLEGYLIGPRNGEVKAALEGGTGTLGGFTVPTEITREFWDMLRARSVFIQAGAGTVMLNGVTRMIVLTKDATAVWRNENQSIGDHDIEVGAFELNPRSLSALVKVSYELLADSANIEEILTSALLGALSLELDRACLFGSGTQNQPVGLYNYPGIGALSQGTNGAVIANYDPLLDMLYELELANSAPPTAAIWHPRTARDLRKRKDTTNQPLMAPDPISGLPKLATTSVPINLTQGTAVGVASPILMGNFGDAVLGMREELVIQKLDQTFAANGQVGFWAHLRADVGFARPKSFVKLDGVIAG